MEAGGLYQLQIRQSWLPYTAADIEWTPNDGYKYEILGGEMIVTEPPWTRHQLVSRNLMSLIDSHVDDNQLGQLFFALFPVHLNRYNVVKPDLLVVLKEHNERIHDDGVYGPPDLIIEIISEVTERFDRIRKAASYATFGVREFWIVDPDDEAIEMYTLRESQFEKVDSDDGVVRSMVIPDLTVRPEDAFDEPDWMQP